MSDCISACQIWIAGLGLESGIYRHLIARGMGGAHCDIDYLVYHMDQIFLVANRLPSCSLKYNSAVEDGGWSAYGEFRSKTTLHRKTSYDQNHHIDSTPYQRKPGRHSEVTRLINSTKSIHVSLRQPNKTRLNSRQNSHKPDNTPSDQSLQPSNDDIQQRNQPDNAPIPKVCQDRTTSHSKM